MILYLCEPRDVECRFETGKNLFSIFFGPLNAELNARFGSLLAITKFTRYDEIIESQY